MTDTAANTHHLLNMNEKYSVVLVRMPRVTPDAMRDLLAGAYRLASATASKRAKLR